MLIEWDGVLTTGIPEIDVQHKEIFDRFNSLLIACEHGRSREEALYVLDFLNTYIKQHFADEENLQQDIDYPDLISHRQEHRQFIASFAELEGKFIRQGSTIQLVIKLGKLLGVLLFEHIQLKDRAFVEFYKNRVNN